MSRDLILKEARSWLGTPYCHQASQKGVGTDCLGVLRGGWRAVIGPEPETPPPYTSDWLETGAHSDLITVADRHLTRIDDQAAQPGDVLLFRFGPAHPAKHCAIMTAPDRILHAYWGRHVCETRLVPWWQRRWCASYAFPTSSQSLAQPLAQPLAQSEHRSQSPDQAQGRDNALLRPRHGP